VRASREFNNDPENQIRIEIIYRGVRKSSGIKLRGNSWSQAQAFCDVLDRVAEIPGLGVQPSPGNQRLKEVWIQMDGL